MEFKRCSKGHVYNPSENATCPVCAAEGSMDAIGATAPVSGFGATAPVGGTEPIASTAPYVAPGTAPASSYMNETQPVTNPAFTPSMFVDNGNGTRGVGAPVQGYEGTMPANINGVPGFSPVVGWLVCTEGADRGTDYRIHNGNNYIGRSPSMDICIRNDMHISHENQAIVGYDDIDRMFFFGPAGGRNAVRVNGKMVINSVQLEPFDVITVGNTKLVFVPLCGEKFDWNEKK